VRTKFDIYVFISEMFQVLSF